MLPCYGLSDEGVGASGVIIWAEPYFLEPSRKSGRRAVIHGSVHC